MLQLFTRFFLQFFLILCLANPASSSVLPERLRHSLTQYISPALHRTLGYKDTSIFEDPFQKGSLGGYLDYTTRKAMDKNFNTAMEKTMSLLITAVIGRWVEPAISYLQFGLTQPHIYKKTKKFPPKDGKIHFDKKTQALFAAYVRQLHSHKKKQRPLPNLLITGAHGNGKSALTHQLKGLVHGKVKTYSAETFLQSSRKEIEYFLKFVSQPTSAYKVLQKAKNLVTAGQIPQKTYHIIVIEEAEKLFSSNLKGEQADIMKAFRKAMMQQTPYVSFVATTHCPEKIHEGALPSFHRRVEVGPLTPELRTQVLTAVLAETSTTHHTSTLSQISRDKDIHAMLNSLSRQDIVDLTAVVDLDSQSFQEIKETLKLHIEQVQKLKQQQKIAREKKAMMQKQEAESTKALEAFYKNYKLKKLEIQKQQYDHFYKS